jgi:hypothetical protein
MLITADRQEGTCYSGIIALIVGNATEIEEARARMLRKDPIHATCNLSSDQIPEEARFADSVIEGGPGLPPKFKLVCARYMHDRDEKIELLEYFGEGFPLDLRFVVARVIDCAKQRPENGSLSLPSPFQQYVP